MRAYARPTVDKAVQDAVAAVWTSRKQAQLLGYLAEHFGQWVRTESLVNALYGSDPNGGPVDPSTNINLFAMRLKPKLAEVGLTIEAKRGAVGGRRLVWVGK